MTKIRDAAAASLGEACSRSRVADASELPPSNWCSRGTSTDSRSSWHRCRRSEREPPRDIILGVVDAGETANVKCQDLAKQMHVHQCGKSKQGTRMRPNYQELGDVDAASPLRAAMEIWSG